MLRRRMGPPEFEDSMVLSEMGAKRPPGTVLWGQGAAAAVVARTTQEKALGRDSAQSPLTDTV